MRHFQQGYPFRIKGSCTVLYLCFTSSKRKQSHYGEILPENVYFVIPCSWGFAFIVFYFISMYCRRRRRSCSVILMSFSLGLIPPTVHTGQSGTKWVKGALQIFLGKMGKCELFQILLVMLNVSTDSLWTWKSWQLFVLMGKSYKV